MVRLFLLARLCRLLIPRNILEQDLSKLTVGVEKITARDL